MAAAHGGADPRAHGRTARSQRGDCAAGREDGLSAALLDRLRLTESRLEAMARATRRGRRVAGAGRRDHRQQRAAQRPVGDAGSRSLGGRVLHLRIAAQRDGRRGVAVRQERQRRHSSRRQRGPSKQPGSGSDPVRGARRDRACRGTPSSSCKRPIAKRSATFSRLHDQIDLAIPRGGRSLIERVAAEATMPVLKHFDGICHVYVDRSADFDMAERILINSKCQRPGVCNAAETLLVHREIAAARSCRGLPRASASEESSCAAASDRGRSFPTRGRRRKRISAPNTSI